ncbi:desmoglein-2-like protein isoform X1 [Ctenopharyngodon idella]|uniref:desmoglein-2-like protein isoform X1 n=1 Tax=Ctenopharyngodon idella TaxID=7959 RepID=UPI002232B5C7|nr:desmoglein-2-like protein isoform X1 [Ctenopharyngodon idella]
MAKLFGFSLFIVLLGLTILKTSASGGQQKKIRQKREWIIPPRKLRENVNYMHLEYIAKIRSDEETRTSIRYSLTGPGADSPPINLFTVDRDKGLVKIHGVLDREETPTYHLRGVAKFLNGSYAEKDIDLRIEVEDENDCAPVLNFTTGSVPELSARDTFIMKITATDADEEGTLHTKISYSIVEESHAGMFYINQETGQIFVMHNTLDREKKDTYTVTIKATDMNGAPNGFTGTGTAVIKILDVNDNIPTLEKNFYECRVEENTKNVEVVRIKATDADLIYSENWLAVFTIVSGNEAGYFSITTDNKTNEGILILNKELDFEELKELRLQVSVSNKAEYHSSVVITESKTYTIQVSVINQPEGPRFKPAVKVITISEESTTIDLRKVITNYAAIDSDTLLIANNVRYAKGKDVDNWLIIDERTADIRLNKFPDYESKFLINNTYYAHIICITNEIPAKTATGTIAIQVKDFNDHCPVLIHQSQRMCYEDHVVYVTAVDKDHFPNGAPFGFNVDEKRTKESWRVEHLNDTTAIFRSETTLWPGVYHVFVDVSDQQGKICAGQMLQIDVCTCDASKVCLPEKTVSRFGVSGVFLMLLGLLLLLLVPLLLLFCLCGGAGVAAGFKTIPTDVKEHLIVYNTEGQGEDKGIPLLPVSKGHDGSNLSNVNAQKRIDAKFGAVKADGSHWSSFNQGDWHIDAHDHQKSQIDEYMYAKRKEELSRFDTSDGLALSDAFLGNYYSQKTGYAARKQDMGDSLKVYEYEGQESCMGSFEDICSFMHEDDNLAFLDDLGLRFKTLAEICSGSTIELDMTTTTAVTFKPVLSTTHKDVDVQETVGLLNSQERGKSSAIIHAAGGQQASSTSSTGMYVHEKVMVSNPTLLVQQPALYYAPATPIYVVEPHPTLVMTSSPALDIQENLLVEEQKSSDATLRGTAKREMQHYQSVVLVEKQPTKGSVQAQGSVSGAVQIVNTEVVQSTESHGVRRAIHPVRTVMAGGAREREVCGSLDMRVPQSLYKHS